MSVIGRRAARHVALALLGSIAFVPQVPAHAARVVDFLYIESNEGGSSGGHAAVRVDGRVYHFEHVAPGLLRMRRATPEAFDYAYATLSNRPIHALHLAVGDEEYARLRETLSRRHVAQDAQFALHEALQRDVALFTHLRRRRVPPAPLPSALAQLLAIPAAGLFADRAAQVDDGDDALHAAATLGSLAHRIAQQHGADFLADRAAGIQRGIEQLPIRDAADCDRPIDPEALPTCALPISTRWHELATTARALDILRDARRLRPGGYQASGDADFRLQADEVAAIDAHANRLEADLVDLVASSRPDWGFGFIIGMARLVTLRASAAQRRLIVAGDSTAALGSIATLQDDPAFPALLAAMQSDAVHDWSRQRATTLAAPEFREADYTALELATHRVIALRQAIGGRRLSAQHLSLYPGAEAANDRTWPIAVPSGTELLRAAAIAAAYDAALERAYGYHLITRNCVTEVLALIDHAADAGATQRSGTSLSLSSALGFIPFVAIDVVAALHRVVAEDVSPSYRQRRMALMSTQEAPVLVALRESNTLTSHAYRPWSRDSTFLLFTSDAVWTRPLFGAVNVAVGAGATALGVLRIPFNGLQPLIAGVRGVLYSLPELAFVNIRKGTFAFVPRHQPRGADDTSATTL